MTKERKITMCITVDKKVRGYIEKRAFKEGRNSSGMVNFIINQARKNEEVR